MTSVGLLLAEGARGAGVARAARAYSDTPIGWRWRRSVPLRLAYEFIEDMKKSGPCAKRRAREPCRRSPRRSASPGTIRRSSVRRPGGSGVRRWAPTRGRSTRPRACATLREAPQERMGDPGERVGDDRPVRVARPAALQDSVDEELQHVARLCGDLARERDAARFDVARVHDFGFLPCADRARLEAKPRAAGSRVARHAPGSIRAGRLVPTRGNSTRREAVVAGRRGSERHRDHVRSGPGAVRVHRTHRA